MNQFNELIQLMDHYNVTTVEDAKTIREITINTHEEEH